MMRKYLHNSFGDMSVESQPQKTANVILDLEKQAAKVVSSLNGANGPSARRIADFETSLSQCQSISEKLSLICQMPNMVRKSAGMSFH